MNNHNFQKLCALTTLACFLLGWPTQLPAAFVCGTDLDGDGLTEENEIASCTTATVWGTNTEQWFCSMDAVDCAIDSHGSFSCPLGDYECLDIGGTVPQCSPLVCTDPDNDQSSTEETDTFYRNDGERAADGNCLGEIYIFSGKATRCRPPGMTVGYSNNCCAGSEPMLMDPKTGTTINSAVTAVSTIYDMAQVGYYAYQMAQGAMAAVEVGGQVVVYNAGGTIAATFASGSAAGAGVMGASATASAAGAGIAGGGTAAAGGAAATVSSGLSSYAAALFNPTTIIIAIIIMVVMKIMMGSGCSAEDIETAMFANSDYCFYLGMFCERKNGLLGCVQMAKRYCCFNSKMARIVHEQGRPQLKSFGVDGGWGTVEEPNCRGFTPDEFQQLDFSKIDLSEYYGDLEEDLSEKIESAQTTVQEQIQEHYQNIR